MQDCPSNKLIHGDRQQCLQSDYCCFLLRSITITLILSALFLPSASLANSVAAREHRASDACSSSRPSVVPLLSPPRVSSDSLVGSASSKHRRATSHARSLGKTSHSPSLATIRHSSSPVLSTTRISGSEITEGFKYLSPVKEQSIDYRLILATDTDEPQLHLAAVAFSQYSLELCMGIVLYRNKSRLTNRNRIMHHNSTY